MNQFYVLIHWFVNIDEGLWGGEGREGGREQAAHNGGGIWYPQKRTKSQNKVFRIPPVYARTN